MTGAFTVDAVGESLSARQARLQAWAEGCLLENTSLGQAAGDLSVVSGDASFRRYFRLPLHQGSLIAVDAPPDKENSRPFVAIARALKAQGVAVPAVLAADFEQGFMLLEDFGDALLRPALTDGTVDLLYGRAMAALIPLLQSHAPDDYALPDYDESRLISEMALLSDWFIPRYLGVTLAADEQAVLTSAFSLIAERVRQQPQVFVHRDYHSRNLMLLENGEIGVIDFQDAVTGPITYDLVSLLRDAYVVWPPESVRKWVGDFLSMLQHSGLCSGVSLSEFQAWFDWMGAQRHLKVVGIFARLSLRDGKHGYLNDIPVVFNYLLAEIQPYAELQPLFELLRGQILPRYLDKHPAARVVLGDWLV